jgi:hypothetical protein
VAANPPIACTLTGQDFRTRLEHIAELNRRSLRGSVLSGRTLELRYASNSLEAVKDLVATESECCAFLAFEIDRHGEEVRLRITVPETAAADALELLSPFLPR